MMFLADQLMKLPLVLVTIDDVSSLRSCLINNQLNMQQFEIIAVYYALSYPRPFIQFLLLLF